MLNDVVDNPNAHSDSERSIGVHLLQVRLFHENKSFAC
jgi:hypothetical protein